MHTHLRRLAVITSAVAAAISGLTTSALATPAQTTSAQTGTPAELPTGTVVGADAPGAIGDSYIVVLHPGATTSADELTKRYGGTVAETYRATVDGFHARMTGSQARRLAADPAVSYVEQDADVRLTGAPWHRADVRDATPWNLDRIDQPRLPLSRSYTAPTAANVTAYVLDTGIRITHRDFGGRASYGHDFVDHDARAGDCNGHGTHVAGTIGGTAYGVAKDVKLVSVRVLGCNGNGSYSAIIAGVDWVTAHAVLPAVANMSLGGSVSRALDEAVNRSIAKGVTYAVAAGNDARDACRQSPADDVNAITVGATDAGDRRASFSNYGSCLDLFAPGARIVSDSDRSDSATQSMSGTSMASPAVAGAAALVLGRHPDWSPARVRDELVAKADPGVVRNPGRNSPNALLCTGFLNSPAGATSRG